MNTQTEEAAEKVKQYILSTGNEINENTIAHAIIFSKKFDDLTGKDADEIRNLLLPFWQQSQLSEIEQGKKQQAEWQDYLTVAADLSPKPEAMQSDAEIEKLADDYADDCGYPKSDKEHFETTYWTQHNIAKHSFISGFKAAQSDAVEFTEWISKFGYSKGSCNDSNTWFTFNDTVVANTTKKLYKLFKASQLKQKQ